MAANFSLWESRIKKFVPSRMPVTPLILLVSCHYHNYIIDCAIIITHEALIFMVASNVFCLCVEMANSCSGLHGRSRWISCDNHAELVNAHVFGCSDVTVCVQ